MTALEEKVATDLSVDTPWAVRHAAWALAGDPHAVAILFYGSVLRTGELGDVLDFYVLTDRPAALLWPTVTFHEIEARGRLIRAKVATMPLTTFERAASGGSLDTTIWTRFAQRSALVWAREPAIESRVKGAVLSAIITAARFAAVLGPKTGRPEDYWKALFDETYHAEFRVEKPGRSALIVAHDPERFATLLPLAWAAGGIPYAREGETLWPDVSLADCQYLIAAWWIRAALGKPLNIVRLLRAAFTFRGAGRYALWKIERHTGVHIEATPWRERHPVLAAPGVLWQLFRAMPQNSYSHQ